MKFIHYTSNSNLKLNSICYLQEQRGFKPKPNGFWISIEDLNNTIDDINSIDDINWHDWCTKEEFRLENLKYSYEIKLKSETNILLLKNPVDIIEFSVKFAAEIIPGVKITNINWQLMAKKYDGIFVAPYQWSLRYDSNCFWYYTWDCASGCIWNLDVIEEIIPLNSIIAAAN